MRKKSDRLVRDKKSEKLYYKGNGVTYGYDKVGSVWSMQVKHRGLISLLWKYFYKQTYKPVVPGEQVVFRFHDFRFDEISEYVAQNYKPLEVIE